MKFLAKGKSINDIKYTAQDDWPLVHVLMAVHNEEKVILEKIDSLISQNYPIEKYQIFIGSDASSDSTNSIVFKLAKIHSNIHFKAFDQRQGKPGVINQLEQLSQKHTANSNHKIYLLTDANVMLNSDTVTNLVRHYKNGNIALVDANMIYQGTTEGGIAASENTYLTREVKIKNNESRAWGKMVGPFGGCYSVRSNRFTHVPDNYLVDDFYIAMHAMKDGALAINDIEAECYEKVSSLSSEEYRRKKRISTGNFQNLFTYWRLLNPFTQLGFALISHKVLRWLGPFLILAMILSAAYLSMSSVFYQLTLSALLCWFLIPYAFSLLSKWFNISFPLFKGIHYFNQMNVALLHGFFSFLTGVKSAIWQPTKR